MEDVVPDIPENSIPQSQPALPQAGAVQGEESQYPQQQVEDDDDDAQAASLASQAVADSLNESNTPLTYFTPAVLELIEPSVLEVAINILEMSVPLYATKYRLAAMLDKLSIFSSIPMDDEKLAQAAADPAAFSAGLLGYITKVKAKNDENVLESKRQADLNSSAINTPRLSRSASLDLFSADTDFHPPPATRLGHTTQPGSPNTSSPPGQIEGLVGGLNNLVGMMAANNAITNPLSDLNSLDPIDSTFGLRSSVIKAISRGSYVSIPLAHPQQLTATKGIGARKRQIPSEKATFLEVLSLIAGVSVSNNPTQASSWRDYRKYITKLFNRVGPIGSHAVDYFLRSTLLANQKPWPPAPELLPELQLIILANKLPDHLATPPCKNCGSISCLGGCPFTKSPQTTSSEKSPKPSTVTPPDRTKRERNKGSEVCRRFNNAKGCPDQPCKYKHECSKCGDKAHTAAVCSVKTKKSKNGKGG